MQYSTMPVWAEINLDSLRHNIEVIRDIVPSKSMIMAVVKANAYGHGAVESSRVFLENSAHMLAVATLSEAIELRKARITAPILILGYTSPEQAESILQWNITSTVYTIECAEGLTDAAENLGINANIHIKIDSGLGRIGFQPNEASFKAISQIKRMPNINIEGIFTHFALADSKDKRFTVKQFNIFENFLDGLTERGINIPIKHASNSAAIIDLPEYSLDMVRPGCILYGLYPSENVRGEKLELKPVMTLKTRVTHMKTVPPSTGISYGLTYTTKSESCIGSLSVGYADGYSRALSNKAEVWVEGVRTPVVGRICMDQTMVDLTDVQKPVDGSPVILFGDGRSGEPRAEDVAKWMGSIADEVVSSVSRRVPRVYTKGGRTVKVVDYLHGIDYITS
jgi:alanine racemase